MTTTYTRLMLRDREEISRGIWANEKFSIIASRIGRPVSTVSREVWRNVKYKWCYTAEKSHRRSHELKTRGRPKKISANPALKEYVYSKLNIEWSPEEIAKRIGLDYPEDKAMRISHETIYHHLYCLPRGELKRELMRGLRHERKMRQPRIYAHYRRQRIKDIISISERPQEAIDRVVPGHWEGDLKDAISVSQSFAQAFKRIPAKFKKSLTYDRGSEMSRHKLFTQESKIQVYFADPYSPWQRGTNENTNGLIRQYFPKRTDFNDVALSEIKEVERRLNSRPRKVLGYYTPSEKFYELLTGRKIALGN